MNVGIIGGGVIGTSCAYHLSDRGHEVTLFERDEIGSGTTAASMAVFVWQAVPPTEFAHRLRRRAWEEYAAFIDGGELEYTRTGLRHVAWSESTLETYREYADDLDAAGVDATVRSGDGPYDDDRAIGELYTPEDGYFDPVSVAELYARKARAAGATIRTGTTVTDLDTESGRVTGLELDGDEIAVDAVVNAAGPWAPAVCVADDDLPLRRTAGPIVGFETDEDVEIPFSLFENDLYVRDYSNGVYVGHYNTDYRDDEDANPDTTATPDDGGAFEQRARNLLGHLGFDADDLRRDTAWTGYRTVTPDGLPIVGEGTTENYYLAVGMSGLGITRAPVVGQSVADAVGGESSSMLREMSPDRFD
ncbi:FAD-dependent oxidoreductase [Haladaptatus sp. W1]|uniref:NAD(P)/FAD-dependent oxidoreductase n=1 Tax=Haladaptatus sp. W1 TaxID=1897478 RepID=UPI000849B396|nr:FAD-dependent oxidoreductase [Haladaptatus sp. W1]ODR83205.1 FAD-dependent oxidoreductase [Haladaptatus sp. W1]